MSHSSLSSVKSIRYEDIIPIKCKFCSETGKNVNIVNESSDCCEFSKMNKPGECLIEYTEETAAEKIIIDIIYEYSCTNTQHPLLGAHIGCKRKEASNSNFFEDGYLLFNLMYNYQYQNGKLLKYDSQNTILIPKSPTKYRLFLDYKHKIMELSIEQELDYLKLGEIPLSGEYAPCVVFSESNTIKESLKLVY